MPIDASRSAQWCGRARFGVASRRNMRQVTPIRATGIAPERCSPERRSSSTAARHACRRPEGRRAAGARVAVDECLAPSDRDGVGDGRVSGDMRSRSVPEVLEPLCVASLGLPTTDGDHVKSLRLASNERTTAGATRSTSHGASSMTSSSSLNRRASRAKRHCIRASCGLTSRRSSKFFFVQSGISKLSHRLSRCRKECARHNPGRNETPA